jgi:hypothetical protein
MPPKFRRKRKPVRLVDDTAISRPFKKEPIKSDEKIETDYKVKKGHGDLIF